MDKKNDPLQSILEEIDFRRILDSVPRLIKLIDLEGNIIFWNDAGERIFGYVPEEIRGQKVWSIYPDQSEEKFRRELQFLKEGKQIDGTFQGKRKDGKVIWVDVKRRMLTLDSGREIILGTANDITDAIKVKKELLHQERRMQAILDTAVEGIITINKKAKIKGFNKAAEEIFGYSSEEVVDKNVKMLMPSPYFEEHDQYMKNYLETGERKIIGIGREVRGKRKNGDVFPMELSVSEVDVNGEKVFTGIVRDISERRRLENEILQISEEERRKIGRELHDGLGQMLTGIGLITQNLANKLKSNELPGGDEVQEIAEMIHEADEQARSLSHGLVHMELEEEGLQVALEQLCRRAKRLFNINCSREFETDFEIDDKVATLHLYRIVQEAISNAVKHGKASEVTVKMSVSGGYLELSVIDDGVGFSNPENMNKLKGIGVNTMNYRAHMLGGYLDMKESSDGLTMLNCKIPLQEFEHFKIK
ncbi:PAS domain S-box protein [Aliifodinibius sp. S!AR15-10]|uniref:PAS domain-containing sensor histidine kinase n=1 Tax=Aliifodinibius sp. S!AR15-10 TaxID=2950437 RepID=UPI002863862C|nr:PAS domain S-box protein [Aliifodinibius sp. S!AR15-10]MDR8393251.1 PAS domain S-box protein [Aliifodinibius sp. S!AR15-10]